MRSKIIWLIIITMFNISLFAIDENSGTTGFAFMKTAFGARSSAMGRAYTGLSDDLEGVYYNPAGLMQLKNLQFNATYVSYFDGVNCGNVAVFRQINQRINGAIFAQFLSATEDKTLMDEMGNYAGTNGTFGVFNLVAGVSLAYRFSSIIDLGINLKYISESIDGNGASAYAFDVAILHQTTNPRLKIGASIKNLGSQLDYYTDNEYDEGLPTSVNVGFKLQARDNLLLVGDLNKPLENEVRVKLGTEYLIHPRFALRAGYNTSASDWKTGGDYDSFAGISLGFGLQWEKSFINYAISSYGDLGFINQISLTYAF